MIVQRSALLFVRSSSIAEGRLACLLSALNVRLFSTTHPQHDSSEAGATSPQPIPRPDGKLAQPRPSDPAAATGKAPTPNSTTTSSTSSTSTSSILQKYVSQELVTDVSSTLNRLTGYEGIDRLKAHVASVDEALTTCKRQLQAAKLEYDKQLEQQTQLHREVTALLQRKSSWVPADVARFTELYAAEHETDRAVAAAKVRYAGLSDDVELLQLKMVDLIRERYQQEQAWSDKIRRASTWWTWGLMGLHFASFVAVYAFIEPRKRAALTAAVAGMLQQHTASINTQLAQLLVAGSQQAGAAGALTRPQQQQQAQRHHQQSRASEAAAGSRQGAPDQQGAAQVQQQVLQELHKVQQQLMQLQQASQQQAAAPQQLGTPGGPSQHASSGSSRQWQWQLPSRQWVSQRVAAAGAVVAQGWQAAVARGQQVTQHFNPLHSLSAPATSEPDASSRQAQAASAASSAGPVSSSSSSSSRSSAQPSTSTSTGVEPSSQVAASQQPAASTNNQQVTHAGTASSRGQQPGAMQGTRSSSSSGKQQSRTDSNPRNGLAQLWAQLQAGGGGGVVELTRAQLGMVGAAACSCGAAVGAAVVLLLTSGAGAGR